MEEEVTTWLRTLIGFGDGSWAVLTSGGVMANIMGLTVARDIHLARLLGLGEPPRCRAGGRARVRERPGTLLDRAGARRPRVPAGDARIVPSDDGPAARGAGRRGDRRGPGGGPVPFAIAPVVGSTNTGSIDLTEELADLAEREDLWLHVDAAYGGAARLPRMAARVPALERADSVTIDPHKWFFQAYDIGAPAVKRREDLQRTFHRMPEYYRHPNPADALNWFEYTLEGTRRFRGLKLWLSSTSARGSRD